MEEIPGRGLAAVVAIGAESTFEILIGNKLLLHERDTVDHTPEHTAALVAEWGAEGNSIVLVALRSLSTSSAEPSPFTLAALFAVRDTPRAESSYVVSQLESQGIAVYLCTGDNHVTARAVAEQVGIRAACVKSGVMPVGKQEFIETLQRGGAEDRLMELRSKAGWWRRLTTRGGKGRAKVLFVGDGVSNNAFGKLESRFLTSISLDQRRRRPHASGRRGLDGHGSFGRPQLVGLLPPLLKPPHSSHRSHSFALDI